MIDKVLFAVIVCGLSTLACNRKSSTESPYQEGVNSELPRFLKGISANDTLALNTDTLLYYQKSACFGFCPTYNYTVYQNGLIRYNGHQHVELLGTRYGLITDSWWKEIMTQLQNIHFFEMANVYPLEEKMYIPDLPNTVIIVKEFGKRKSIIDNHNAPKELKDFELLLENKFKEINFK